MAPFVGVALAVLTAGSLVLFSVIAQRTSLEGFSARGVGVAPAPPRETTGSITVPAAPEANTSGSDSEETAADEGAEPDASELLLVGDDETAVATTSAVQGEPGAPSDADASITQDGDTEVAVAADANDLTPFFRMAAGGADNGEVEADADATKANGRDGDKKDKKAKKTKKGKKDKKPKKAKASKRSRSPGRSAHGDRGSSRSASASSRRPSKAAASSRSARSSRSRPAQASRASAPKPRPSSNHQNQRGKGHSKARGKGHRH